MTTFLPELAAAGSGGGGDGSTVLLQYGAVGFIALVALLTVKVLFARLESQYQARDQERQRELERVNARADRLEGELAKLNQSVRESMQALTTANTAVAEAMSRMRRDR